MNENYSFKLARVTFAGIISLILFFIIPAFFVFDEMTQIVIGIAGLAIAITTFVLSIICITKKKYWNGITGLIISGAYIALWIFGFIIGIILGVISG